MTAWTTANIPSQAGKLAIVTGATGGLGYETALALAGAGAEVILAGRNPDKGDAALAAIRGGQPGAAVSFERVDLASLDSVAAFAGRMLAADRPIDLLINNAGVMALPKRQETADGFEQQLGTNYLSHFALTGRLLPLLRRADRPRVVQLSSVAHRNGRLDFGDLQAERRYQPWAVYSQSKLAMLVFAMELQRRSDANGWGLVSVAAHPGWARTDLIANGPAAGAGRRLMLAMENVIFPLLGQSAAAGALPTLYAATAPEVRGGEYYGPLGAGERRGAPGRAEISQQAWDLAAAARLWEESERLTGVSFAARRAAA
ncbi:MAG TPA: oxidoreductase [Herpetosiphonaceae bacterium]